MTDRELLERLRGICTQKGSLIGPFLETLREAFERLLKFKEFTHKHLDDLGIETFENCDPGVCRMGLRFEALEKLMLRMNSESRRILEDDKKLGENVGALWTIISQISEPIRKCFVDRTMPFGVFSDIAAKWVNEISGENHPDTLRSERDALRAQLASLKASPAGDGILEEIEKLYRSWNPLEPGVVANWLIDNYDRLRLALSRESVSVLGDDGHPIESPELIHDFNSGSGKGGKV